MSNNNNISGPTPPSERIFSLDVLRGFALLGILFANIQITAMIKIAEFNPAAYGDLTGFNYIVAMLTNVLINRKFMLLFSMLFGAGIVLMAERIESKGKKSAVKHYPRMFWLFIIGSLHHYLLAPGEILAYYAVAGLIVYLCRKLSPRRLLIYGLLLLLLYFSFDAIWQYTFSYRSPEEIKMLDNYYWTPNQELIKQEQDRYHGSWLDQVVFRVKERTWFYTKNFYIYSIWIWLGIMLIGMALYKWGIFTARARDNTYRKLLFICLPLGLFIVVLGWILNDLNNWKVQFSMIAGAWFNQWGGIILMLGYVSGIILIIKKGRFKNITKLLGAYGRMALTNYLMQSVICAILFFGWGFGLSGKVERWGQFLIVIPILAFQVWYSNLWLKHFRFGPAEWLWRSLSYWKFQPMKKPDAPESQEL